MNPMLAIQYIRKNGNPIDQARLNFLMHDQLAFMEIVADFCASQNRDGSWSPFWSPDYSSLDATCFHLAQVQQLGMNINEPAITTALEFIADLQKNDGSWEEEQSIAEIAPPWAKPWGAIRFTLPDSKLWILVIALYFGIKKECYVIHKCN